MTKGILSKAGFYYESYLSAYNYVVREGGPTGRYIGQVTKIGTQWRASLGFGVVAKGPSKDKAVLKALKIKEERAANA
ncbi:hypothetical protein H1164_03485 [Thermoactinomyces daqus]|uniref:DRBM domain-containing protein n=1 Tax=Thermoactinomyces daqus TaxID=1329516 RepID=A0A7W2AHA3_9BACL|nr:hypothetical protein [Thermoactinomyces daqus]MBA4541965.1 hypothetical protein [Thermoactinomyces daqus]